MKLREPTCRKIGAKARRMIHMVCNTNNYDAAGTVAIAIAVTATTDGTTAINDAPTAPTTTFAAVAATFAGATIVCLILAHVKRAIVASASERHRHVQRVGTVQTKFKIRAREWMGVWQEVADKMGRGSTGPDADCEADPVPHSGAISFNPFLIQSTPPTPSPHLSGATGSLSWRIHLFWRTSGSNA